MAYPRELLNEGEDLVLDLRPHWWYFAKNFAVGIGLLAFAILIMFLPSSSTSGDSTGANLLASIRGISGWILFILMLIWAFTMVVAYFQWIFTFFVVTSDRVIYRTGIIAKNGTEIPLERLNNIHFNRSIFERIIGAGTLVIESAGETGKSVFRDVRHPDAVVQEINRCREENDRKTARYGMEGLEEQFAERMNVASNPQPESRAQMSIPEQIEKLAELRDNQIISEAEFEEKRQRLLDQI